LSCECLRIVANPLRIFKKRPPGCYCQAGYSLLSMMAYQETVCNGLITPIIHHQNESNSQLTILIQIISNNFSEKSFTHWRKKDTSIKPGKPYSVYISGDYIKIRWWIMDSINSHFPLSQWLVFSKERRHYAISQFVIPVTNNGQCRHLTNLTGNHQAAFAL
jgi:hypothetical protein